MAAVLHGTTAIICQNKYQTEKNVDNIFEQISNSVLRFHIYKKVETIKNTDFSHDGDVITI